MRKTRGTQRTVRAVLSFVWPYNLLNLSIWIEFALARARPGLESRNFCRGCCCHLDGRPDGCGKTSVTTPLLFGKLTDPFFLCLVLLFHSYSAIFASLLQHFSRLQTTDCTQWYAFIPKGQQLQATVCFLDVSLLRDVLQLSLACY